MGMSFSAKGSIFILRVVLGWLMFYAGITKMLDPNWTAANYIASTATFEGFYNWLISPGVIDVINLLNVWGLTLLGVSLILGIFVRLSSFLGAILMFLYYLPVLDFPYAGSHSFLVDEHIIYIFIFLLFITVDAGKIYGFDDEIKRTALRLFKKKN